MVKGRLPDSIRAFIGSEEFPCIMAKTALTRDHVLYCHAGRLGSGPAARRATWFLHRFVAEHRDQDTFHSAVCGFEPLPSGGEKTFEQLLWRQLQRMHDMDRRRYRWDEAVTADPDDPEFSFSIGNEAFYVIGMHPGASRPARRAPRPLLVFNRHAQFEELRERGKYQRVRDLIRDRDRDLAGDINPMLADFGERSEAIQYSGREASNDWQCPLQVEAHRDHQN